ncbi:MAG TPA: CoA-binding protein [Candidatus Aquicultor sp.]|jgi:hypothetical protein
MNRSTIERACRKGNVIAIVGASNDHGKYGYRVYNDLKNGGYKVYPVNPNEKHIQDDQAYPDVQSLPEKPDVVDIVTPPNVTEKVVKEAVEQGINIIWMQPGSESQAAIEYVENSPSDVVYDTCIMVERRHYA